jgi:hypothetical protein
MKMKEITQVIEQWGSELFTFMTTTYVGAILIILFATVHAWFKLNNDKEIPMFSMLQGEIQGWIAVVLLYMLGFAVLYFKITGQV